MRKDTTREDVIREVETMVKPDYKFPSQILVNPNEVEKGLRRKFRSEKQPSMWVLLLIAIIIATLGYLIVGRVVDDQAHAATVAHSDLCEQYLNDTALEGTAAQETLNDICL